MIGRVFNNRYQITERIGIGGMAEVYRAQDNVLGRLVAVKVMLRPNTPPTRTSRSASSRKPPLQPTSRAPTS